MYEESTTIRAELPAGGLRTEKIGALMVAKAKAQGEFPDVKRTTPGQDGNRRFKYADLGEIRKATQPALSKYGLAWESFFATEPIGEGEGIRVYVWTELHHGESEQYQRTPIATFTVAGEAMKQIGGATSYLRRYQAQALLGVAAEDDNAEEAGDQERTAPPRAAPPKPPPEKTLEPGEDPPAMKADPVAECRAAIEAKAWNRFLATIAAVRNTGIREQLQKEYQAARNAEKKPTTTEAR